jgi:hypothetical protein
MLLFPDKHNSFSYDNPGKLQAYTFHENSMKVYRKWNTRDKHFRKFFVSLLFNDNAQPQASLHFGDQIIST